MVFKTFSGYVLSSPYIFTATTKKRLDSNYKISKLCLYV